jgi:hypothetical protein
MSSRFGNNLTDPGHRHNGDDSTLFFDMFGSLTSAFSLPLLHDENFYITQNSARFGDHHDQPFHPAAEQQLNGLLLSP